MHRNEDGMDKTRKFQAAKICILADQNDSAYKKWCHNQSVISMLCPGFRFVLL